MDEGIAGPAVAAVLQAHGGLQHFKEGFNDASLAQQHLVQQGQQIVLHGAANAGDPVKDPLPEALQQRLGKIAFISKDLPC